MSEAVVKVGIKDSKEVKAFVVALIKGGMDAKKNDGKITGSDFVYLGPALLVMPAALDGISNVGAEFKDLDPAELQELAGDIAKDLGLADSIVADVTDAIEVLKRIVAVVNRHRVIAPVA